MIRPTTLGQATRIQGVTPAGISLLAVMLRRGHTAHFMNSFFYPCPSMHFARLALILWQCMATFEPLQSANPEPIVPVCILIRLQNFEGKPMPGVTVSWQGDEKLLRPISEFQPILFKPVQTDAAGSALIYAPGTSHFYRNGDKYMRRESVEGKLHISKIDDADIDIDLAKATQSPFEREENRVVVVHVSLLQK